MNIDFYSQYININFDEILLENNNDLINSEEFYLIYKKTYFDETLKNFEKFKIYNSELNELSNLNDKTTSKYKHVYIDTIRFEFLKQSIKNIVIFQNKLLDNFHHYITLLNTHPEKFKSKNEDNINIQKRGFLSKLFDPKDKLQSKKR